MARAELPTITAENKEFFSDAFIPEAFRGKFDELDKLKHDGKKFDFTVDPLDAVVK